MEEDICAWQVWHCGALECEGYELVEEGHGETLRCERCGRGYHPGSGHLLPDDEEG